MALIIIKHPVLGDLSLLLALLAVCSNNDQHKDYKKPESDPKV